MGDDGFIGKEYYGGEGNPYEAIKVILHYNLSFCRGNVIKYILRAGKKEGEDTISDLKKARAYLDYEIWDMEKKKK